MGALVAQSVERWTCNWKVAGLNPDWKVYVGLFPKTKLLAISPMIFDLQASYLEYMHKTVKDYVNSDLVKRSRSQIKVKRFEFSGAVFVLTG